MIGTLTNLYRDIPTYSKEEVFTTLLAHPQCRIERIVSYGQSSPEVYWYDQDWDEWILLIKGSAEMDVDGVSMKLAPGDHLLIPARVRHRVVHTSKDQPTIWLAIHFNEPTKN